VRIFQLLDVLGRNIRTDISLAEMKDLISLAQQADTKNITRKVFDTTPEGLLYQTKSDNDLYILLPQGDNFEKIHEVCINIFQ